MALAPMYGVTDTAFRQMLSRSGKPDVMFTEFVSVDGLCNEKSRQKLVDHYLCYSGEERPLVAQIWGNDPEKFRAVAALIRELGFDGVDINMGCPDRAVIKCGMGGALIKEPALAKEIVCATQEGAWSIPVSVKTRIGFDNNVLEDWIGALLSTHPAAITVHARTVREMSRVPADWQSIKHAARLARGTGTLILGNGDVRSLKEARMRVEETEADGVMFGRGIFGNYWLFDENRTLDTIPLEERVSTLVEHARLFEKHKGERNFRMFYKHVQAYISGFTGAKELRILLMKRTTAKEMESVLRGVIKTNPTFPQNETP